MRSRESAEEIDAAAAEWAVKLGERDDPELAAQVDAWLKADRRRAGALLRAQAALSYLDRGRALVAPGDTLPNPGGYFRASRRHVLVAASLAGVAATIAGLALWYPRAKSYETAIGEIRHVPLQDGSTVAINTASEIDVELKPELRQVDLDRGEVWFKVAKDPARPFIVAAGAVRVRAVGTAFSVRRRSSGTDVVVAEGVVETWNVGDETQKITLTAGQKAVMSDAEQPQIAMIGGTEVERTLAWRNGQISLYGESVATAAAEFNRYNATKLTIDDPHLAEEKVVGQFHTDEPEAFARAVVATLGARMTQERGGIQLSRPPKK